MKVLSQESSSLVGAYVCPDGFVSQVVYFSLKPNREWFERMVSEQVGSESLSPRDIRIASRHGWELGAGGREILQSKLGEGGIIREIYWTRYPKTEEQKHQGVSLCIGEGAKAGCMKLFMHDRNSVEKLCPACKPSTANETGARVQATCLSKRATLCGSIGLRRNRPTSLL